MDKTSRDIHAREVYYVDMTKLLFMQLLFVGV